jgi:hypothetical protein
VDPLPTDPGNGRVVRDLENPAFEADPAGKAAEPDSYFVDPDSPVGRPGNPIGWDEFSLDMARDPRTPAPTLRYLFGHPTAIKDAVAYTSTLPTGSTVYLRGGLHPVSPVVSPKGLQLRQAGSAMQPVKITSYPGEEAVITNMVVLKGWQEDRTVVDGGATLSRVFSKSGLPQNYLRMIHARLDGEELVDPVPLIGYTHKWILQEENNRAIPQGYPYNVLPLYGLDGDPTAIVPFQLVRGVYFTAGPDEDPHVYQAYDPQETTRTTTQYVALPGAATGESLNPDPDAPENILWAGHWRAILFQTRGDEEMHYIVEDICFRYVGVAAKIDLKGSGNSSVVLRDCRIENTGAEGILTGNTAGQDDAHTADILITGCSFDKVGAHGIYFSSNHGTIEGCEFHNVCYGSIHNYNFSRSPVGNSIHHNVIRDPSPLTYPAAYSGIAIYDWGVDTDVQNNLITGPHNVGISRVGSGGKVLNNTIAGAKKALATYGTCGNPKTIGTVFRNNALIAPAGGTLACNMNPVENTFDHNAYKVDTGLVTDDHFDCGIRDDYITAVGEDVVDSDFLFVDPAFGDYSLLPGSPLIDAGSNDLVDWPLDLAGNLRIDGASVNIGAYE